MRGLRGRLRLELPEDFFDSIEDERERVHYRAALDPRATFPELYRQLKVRLHLHLYESSENEPRNYCAVFGYYPVAHGGKASRTRACPIMILLPTRPGPISVMPA